MSGQGAHFCAGGDISEYAAFRFHEATLREFHEVEVWGALRAMLACDVPMVAQIAGNCMGAGVEIASCCDIRLAAESAQFGAPIARLGFPMAPREAALVAREVGPGDCPPDVAGGGGAQCAGDAAARVFEPGRGRCRCQRRRQATVRRICQLAPQAARLNKQTLRVLNSSPVLMDAMQPDTAQRSCRSTAKLAGHGLRLR